MNATTKTDGGFCDAGASFNAWYILAGRVVLIVVLALTFTNETLRVLDEERWTNQQATAAESSTTAPESEAAR